MEPTRTQKERQDAMPLLHEDTPTKYGTVPSTVLLGASRRVAQASALAAALVLSPSEVGNQDVTQLQQVDTPKQSAMARLLASLATTHLVEAIRALHATLLENLLTAREIATVKPLEQDTVPKQTTQVSRQPTQLCNASYHC